jgi:hypothetical protein
VLRTETSCELRTRTRRLPGILGRTRRSIPGVDSPTLAAKRHHASRKIVPN